MNGPLDVIDFPSEDSPDLTNDELAVALDAQTPDDIAKGLTDFRCCACAAPYKVISKHQLRRRAPHFYARVLLSCQNGHQGSVLFRAHFLGGVF